MTSLQFVRTLAAVFLAATIAGCAAAGTDPAPQPDCSDGQCDETQDRSPANCRFLCGDGTCLPPDRVCNGTADCPDSEDEHVTYCGTPQCGDSQLTCPDGSCVAAEAICNGVADCEGGEDESMCNQSCGLTDVSCSDWVCIPREALCDGRGDCLGDEDESGC